ncbi:hypothetical protein [Candidatus Enterovibrio escicola]|uniref:hypothetical protein n=1 Tax=Candidatus Enterovibrio escicola TaxID=1927127 RepID=UPI001CC2FE20|nr:hypothetical protein [Candidatus Enterovibrio escacola]
MQKNIVTQIRDKYFGGSFAAAARAFDVSATAYRKWELELSEFPANQGRMQRAHEITGLEYQILSPSIFKPTKCAA